MNLFDILYREESSVQFGKDYRVGQYFVELGAFESTALPVLELKVSVILFLLQLYQGIRYEDHFMLDLRFDIYNFSPVMIVQYI